MYLEAALLLDEYLDVTYVAPAPIPAAHGTTFDVTIFDGVTPRAVAPAVSLLYLNPSGRSLAGEGRPRRRWSTSASTRSTARARSCGARPSTTCTSGKAPQARPLAGDKVVGASDKGAASASPGRRDQQRFVALGFDPRDSDLVLRIAWPLFVLNVVSEFAAEDASYLSSFRTGEVWHVPVPTASTEVRLRAPRSPEPRLIPVEDGRAVFLGLDAGFYTMETGPAGAVVKSEFAANLADAEESAIDAEARARGRRQARGARRRVSYRRAQRMVGRVAPPGARVVVAGVGDLPSEDHGMRPRLGHIVMGALVLVLLVVLAALYRRYVWNSPEATLGLGTRRDHLRAALPQAAWGSPCSPRSFS